MKRALIPILLAALSLAPAALAAARPTVQVRTAKIRRHRLSHTVTAFGTVRPDPTAQTTMDATFPAFVQRVDVTLGQPVHAGDPLLVLRTAPTARARFLSARAEVRYARRLLKRKRELLNQKLATRADVDSAENALQKAKAAYAAQQELGTGRRVRIITAPFTGIVAGLSVRPGNEVQAGSQLFQLARRDRLQVALGVEPDEADHVHHGMTVRIMPLFGAGRGVTATVARVNAVVDPKTRLVDVIVHLRDGRAKPFLPGMRVKGTITLSTRRSLAVPRSAVLRDNRGDYVFIVRHGRAHRVAVRKGLENGSLVGVRGRLKAGQQVVVQGNYELSDGMRVRPAP